MLVTAFVSFLCDQLQVLACTARITCCTARITCCTARITCCTARITCCTARITCSTTLITYHPQVANPVHKMCMPPSYSPPLTCVVKPYLRYFQSSASFFNAYERFSCVTKESSPTFHSIGLNPISSQPNDRNNNSQACKAYIYHPLMPR
jgi:hypothetical protein